ncbi:hypothetical protein [Streptomyces sp. NPDC126499]|uniref:hypothetical protein n=1 Tax=Streptomyces sp. NPDC126499 TaxID=3155314 RepID=UPI003330D61E
MAERKSAPKDEAQAEVQAAVDEAEGKGYIGVPVDPTPKENYTVAGVLAGKPTPETDPEHARKVRQELDEARKR